MKIESETKMKIPEVVVAAFLGDADYESWKESGGHNFGGDVERLEMALRCLSEHPIIPSSEITGSILSALVPIIPSEAVSVSFQDKNGKEVLRYDSESPVSRKSSASS